MFVTNFSVQVFIFFEFRRQPTTRKPTSAPTVTFSANPTMSPVDPMYTIDVAMNLTGMNPEFIRNHTIELAEAIHEVLVETTTAFKEGEHTLPVTIIRVGVSNEYRLENLF